MHSGHMYVNCLHLPTQHSAEVYVPDRVWKKAGSKIAPKGLILLFETLRFTTESRLFRII